MIRAKPIKELIVSETKYIPPGVVCKCGHMRKEHFKTAPLGCMKPTCECKVFKDMKIWKHKEVKPMSYEDTIKNKQLTQFKDFDEIISSLDEFTQKYELSKRLKDKQFENINTQSRSQSEPTSRI